MAPKRPTHDLSHPTHSSESESEDQEHSSSSDESDSEPQQLTQSKPQKPLQESQESSDSGSDSSSDKTQMPPSVVSPEPKKPTSKSTQLKANGKRPAETEQIEKVSKSKKSKGIEKVEKYSKSDKSNKSVEKVDKGSQSDEKVDKGSKSDEKVEKDSKSDKSNKSVEKVDKGSKSDEKVDKGSKSDEKIDKGLKKSKIINGDEEGGEIEDKKATLFARLFTEKDDIVLLEGMIDYKEKKGADPSWNIVAFHESVEDLLSCSVTKSQIVDKIRRLKKKFMNYVRKGQNGGDPVISRLHEYKSFELSKKIWGSEVRGSEVDGDSRVRSSRRKNKKDENVGSSKTPLKLVGKKESDIEEEVTDKTEAETDTFWSLYPFLCSSLESEAIKNFTGPMSPKEFVKKVVSAIEKEKASELEQEWKGFIVMEQQVYAKRVKMISKQAEIAMNVIQP